MSVNWAEPFQEKEQFDIFTEVSVSCVFCIVDVKDSSSPLRNSVILRKDTSIVTDAFKTQGNIIKGNFRILNKLIQTKTLSGVKMLFSRSRTLKE